MSKQHLENKLIQIAGKNTLTTNNKDLTNSLRCINYLLIQIKESNWIEDDLKREQHYTKVCNECEKILAT